jgi:DNA-binding IclR family transcriptional regulator
MASAVRAADRTLDVFELFGALARPLSLAELGKAAAMAPSSCHALVTTLERRGYLYSSDRRRSIYPTRRLLDLAQSIVAHDPLLVRLEPALTRLRDDTGETVILGTRQGDEVLYLDVIEGTQTVRYTARAGERKPLHSSAAGKALLAGMDETARHDWIAGRKLPGITRNTLTRADALLADLAAGAKRGYVATRGENVIDVMAIAAPARIDGTTVAIAIAGPLARIEAAVARHAAALRRTLAALDTGRPA